MMIGWWVGLNVKPDLEELHRAALELVPASAEVAEETLMDQTWVLFNPWPSEVHLELTSGSVQEQLVDEMSTRAERSGWRLVEVDERPGATVQILQTFLLRASTRVWRSESREHDASIRVAGREGVGRVITTSASMATGLLAAVVAGIVARTRRGKEPLHFSPIRWFHVLGVVVLVLVFLLSLRWIP
jgi:hypothetical protein